MRSEPPSVGCHFFNGPLTRRDALRQISAGTLLALGLWPGALRAANAASERAFRFIVVNDTHYMSPECGTWLEGVIRQMKMENAEFCLHAGDLTEKGTRNHLHTVKDLFHSLAIPVYPVIGNHDYTTQTDRKAYVAAFPMRINYFFRHRGWQFIGLDTSDGQRYEKTSIRAETFQWLREYLARLNRKQPTVLFTHFPLGENVTYRPSNADALLDHFREFNLQGVFCGHFHGSTERPFGATTVLTNQCCALKRANHDKSKAKGYFICSAENGRISRRFVECKVT